MRDFAINSEGFHLFTFLLSKITQPCPHCSGNNGGGNCYVMILRNNSLRHSGPIFSAVVLRLNSFLWVFCLNWLTLTED